MVTRRSSWVADRRIAVAAHRRTTSRTEEGCRTLEAVEEGQRPGAEHAGVRNARSNLIHETTTMLAKNYDVIVIVIENLNVAGMMNNHALAKHNADWAEFSRQLEYKTKWYGSTLVKAGRFYASSKTFQSPWDSESQAVPR